MPFIDKKLQYITQPVLLLEYTENKGPNNKDYDYVIRSEYGDKRIYESSVFLQLRVGTLESNRKDVTVT
ncbi:hypothetical protein EG330_13355 [Pectobacterium versatile]|nr:hypothetical protein EG330_13355 [Pectobacterium versatile]